MIWGLPRRKVAGSNGQRGEQRLRTASRGCTLLRDENRLNGFPEFRGRGSAPSRSRHEAMTNPRRPGTSTSDSE